MPPCVVGVHEAVVIDEVSISSVVGRVYIDALDSSCVAHAEVAEGVEVVSFDDEVFPRCVADAESGVYVERDEIGIECFVAFDFAGFPDEAKARSVAPVAGVKKPDKFVVRKMRVFRHRE
jgi:hypothetical protein